jgi:GIY-YIG catalytic domain
MPPKRPSPKKPTTESQAGNRILGLPEDVAAIRAEISKVFDTLGSDGKKVGNSKHGVYAFYDYDGEPIYVGQTCESLRQRIGRHLTNQRTDAVAMNVLDPFEVAEIEMWPLDAMIESIANDERTQFLNRAEYTVFQKVLGESAIGAVLNEKEVIACPEIDLPESVRRKIIPDSIFEQRRHPDIRIARRASTIANLARVISERHVSNGLRFTLLTQAQRLERLSSTRIKELGIAKKK